MGKYAHVEPRRLPYLTGVLQGVGSRNAFFDNQRPSSKHFSQPSSHVLVILDSDTDIRTPYAKRTPVGLAGEVSDGVDP